MNFPKELKYTESHEWILEEDGKLVIGITDYSQDSLGDIMFINLPEKGEEVTAGEPFTDLESVKTVSEIYSPVTGVIAEVNEELMDNPGAVNADPYNTWIIKIQDVTNQETYMSADSYADYVDGLDEE